VCFMPSETSILFHLFIFIMESYFLLTLLVGNFEKNFNLIIDNEIEQKIRGLFKFIIPLQGS
jgi:hypothetical protein